MKLWATLAVAGLTIAAAFASPTTPVQDNGNEWSINVGFAIPEGDLKDGGVDSMFSLGADWMLGYGMGGDTTTQSFVGLWTMFGDGDADLEVMTWGVHYGLMFPLDANANNNWHIRLTGGYFNTNLEMGTVDSDEWGFGGSANIAFRPTNGTFSFSGGYYFMPEVEGVDNRGWIFQVHIPVR